MAAKGTRPITYLCPVEASDRPAASGVPDGSVAVCADSGVAYMDINDSWVSVVGGGGAGSVSIVNRKSAPTTISSSTTETAVYTYVIAGGTLGATDALHLDLLNEFFNNTGANRGIRVRVKLGGATVIDWDSGNNFASNATRRLFSAEVDVSSMGATNSQIVSLAMSFLSVTTTFGTVNTGTGTPASANTSDLMLHSGTLSNDMTSSQTLEVTYQLSFSSANLETVTYSGSLVLLNA